MSCITIVVLKYWIAAALMMSIFWGFRSVVLFTTDPILRLPEGERDPKLYFLRHKHKYLGIWFIGLYQFIFNFVGSMAGWCCFYALVLRVHTRLPDLRGFSSGDILLFVFSLLGLTGHLPQVIYGFVQSFSEIGKAALKKAGIARE